MKASCKTADFVREVAAVSKSASTKSTLPILGNILIETTKGGLFLSATNLESRLRAFIPGKVEEAGSTTVDIKTLVHLIGQFDKNSRTDLLLLDDGRLLVTDGGEGTSGRLPTIDPLEMPFMPDYESWPIVALLRPDLLKDRLDKAIPFCASDEARPILTSVHIEAKEKGLTFGAANNYVVVGTDLDAVVEAPGVSANVPAVTLKLLASLVADDTVAYRVNSNRPEVAFTFDNYVFISRAIDGMYPNYEQVLPSFSAWDGEAGSYGVTVDRKSLLKALKLCRKDDIVRLVTGPDALVVQIMDYDKKPLFAKSIPATVNPVRDEVSAFNPTLLTLALNSISATTVTLFRNSPDVNHVLGIDSGDPQFRCAVMPVKVSS